MSWNPRERPVFEPDYWKGRLEWARSHGCLHHSVFNTDVDTWAAVAEKHRKELAKYIQSADSILDAGCAYGRMIDLLPSNWIGPYLGIDVSPDFIEFAQNTYPGRAFAVCDLRDLSLLSGKHYDWGVVISVKRVIIGHAGQEVWDGIQEELLKFCGNLLILDYDPVNEAEIVG